PPKIKIVFAQRHDDVLAADSEFRNYPNVICIPDNGLNALEEIDVDELIKVHPAINKYKLNNLKRAISIYAGHPYACVAALDMLMDGLPLSDLPVDPTPEKIAETQFNRIFQCGDEMVVNFFKTYAVINHPTYDKLVADIIGISKHKIQYLRRSNPFVNGLLKKTPDGYGIYHSLLSDYILSEMNEDEINELRALIVSNYKSCIQSKGPQCDIAARFLGPRIFNLDGADSFVRSFLEFSAKLLIDFGFLQEAFDQINIALKFVSLNSIEKAKLHRLLGNIYYLRGEYVDAEREYKKAIKVSSDLDYFEGLANSYGNLGVLYWEQNKFGKAKSMHLRSFKVEHRLKRAYGMAADLGNIGLVFLKQGKINIAEKYFIKSLRINKQIDRPEGVAKQYENLGVLYREIGEYSRSKMMHQRALEIEIELNRVEGIGRNYKGIGEIYGCLGRKTEACNAFIKAKRIYEKSGMIGEARCLEKVIEAIK
ncbi:tetratricopeptide repeat protein, partial [bacterium]|nr:tetratricopeptide repeat protein [bacterium]